MAHTGRLIEARVPPGSLRRLSRSPGVAYVRVPAKPVADGLGEGAAAANAGVWHANGLDGSGIKVAIIDLGFHGYASMLGTALPASVTTIDRCGGAFSAAPPTGTAHGAAVAEIVHQMAPGAALLLICVDSEVGLAQAELDAEAAGARIVNHSVSWPTTSRGNGTGGPPRPTQSSPGRGRTGLSGSTRPGTSV